MTDNILYDREAEKTIVGSILAQPDAMNLLGDLGLEDFVCPEWKVAFMCCLNLWQRGEAISSTTVLSEFEKIRGELKKHDQVEGDFTYLVGQAITSVISPGNVALFAHEVRSLAVRRRGAKAMKDIVAQFNDRQTPLIDVLDNARAAIDELNWAPQSSRFVLFRDGEEIGGEHPMYVFNVLRPSDCCPVTIRVKSEQLDKRVDIGRVIREALHFNPKLPPIDKWGDFINSIVSNTKRTETPDALKEDSETIFWLREWFKTATPAETVDDMVNGYVLKKDYYYIQPQRVLKWLTDHAKIKPTITDLWTVLSRHGGRRDVSIRLKDKPRKLWGVPVSFIEPREEESQLGIDDVDLGDYSESEDAEKTEESES